MPIITLTTDLGLKDYYVSSIKGAILSQTPDVTIVDISHNVPKFSIQQAAFMIKNVLKDFPAGTIHVIGVLPQASGSTPHIAVKAHGQYFISADNGIFSLIFDTKPDKMVELNIMQDVDDLTFPTKDVFVKAACHLARGGTLEVIGKPHHELVERSLFRAVVDNNTIRGTVIYIDSYGNVVANITRQLFKDVGRGRPFTISFRVPGYDITHISETYQSVIESERLALFGSSGYLEIAINIGDASKLLGLKINDIVRIEFHDR